jgi:hypothetical protein
VTHKYLIRGDHVMELTEKGDPSRFWLEWKVGGVVKVRREIPDGEDFGDHDTAGIIAQNSGMSFGLR